MKKSLKALSTALLGGSALVTAGTVYAASDFEECQAGYKIMLMTPGECRGYLKELRAARSRADDMAVLDLQEWHAELLIERSQACPCRQAPAVLQRIGSNDSSRRIAYSEKY